LEATGGSSRVRPKPQQNIPRNRSLAVDKSSRSIHVNFVTTVKVESTVFPGVSFTLNKMSEARRAQLRLMIAEPTSRIRNLLREMGNLEEKYPNAETSPRPEDVTNELLALSDKMEQISSDEINPKWLKWGLKSIEGLDIDGVPATPETLLSDGPPALFMEIVSEIKRVAQLSGDEEKNSASPTTSGEPTGGGTTNISAVGANSSEHTTPEIAPSTSQN
jgi:hypothetical protein